MELWEEYCIRHNMPVIRAYDPFYYEPPQIIIRQNPPLEHRVWAYFLAHYQPMIRPLETEEWQDAIMTCRGNAPGINEQRAIVFHRLPALEAVWTEWQELRVRQNRR
jgi:hypothetical protein